MYIDFLKWTAWEMTPPPAYGTFHLTFFFVGLALSIFLAWQLRKLNDRQNRILLIGIGLFLILFEVYKITFRYFVVYKRDINSIWWLFPFQLCSVPMYLCVIAPLLKNKTVSGAMYDFMLAFNLFGGFVAFTEPSGLVHHYWTLTIHAFVWHMSLVFIGLYLGFSGRAGMKLENYKRTVVLYLILCTIAFGINCAFWKVSGGTMNNFYIGPANSPLVVFKTICEKYGWIVNDLIYIPLNCLGAFLFYVPFCLVRKKLPGRRKAHPAT